MQLLRSGGGGEVQAAAAGGLAALACSPEGRQAVREAGALEALLACVRGSEHEAARQAALSALAGLASEHATQKALAKAGAVQLLLELAQGGSDALKPAACRLLLELSSLKAARRVVVDGGGLPALLPLLRPGLGESADTAGRLRLTRMLASAAGDSSESREALAAAGCLPLLLAFLLEGNQTMAPGRGAAVEALAALCCAEDGEAGGRRRRQLGGAHGVYALLGFLHTCAQHPSGLAHLFRWAGHALGTAARAAMAGTRHAPFSLAPCPLAARPLLHAGCCP